MKAPVHAARVRIEAGPLNPPGGQTVQAPAFHVSVLPDILALPPGMAVDEVSVRHNAQDELSLGVTGHVLGRALDVTAELGKLKDLVAGDPTKIKLGGTIDQLPMSLRGYLPSLQSLAKNPALES